MAHRPVVARYERRIGEARKEPGAEAASLRDELPYRSLNLRKLVRITFLRLRDGRADHFGTIKVVLIRVEHTFKASIPGS